MFERFTERARQTVNAAQQGARELGHDHIAPEHLLLALLRVQEGIAAQVLQSLNVTAEQVTARMEPAREVDGETAPPRQIPFTPPAKKVLEGALREAVALRHNHIGTEHILLGLVREPDEAAARILRECGADADAVRAAVMRQLPARPGGVQSLPSKLGGSLRRRSVQAIRLAHAASEAPPAAGSHIVVSFEEADGLLLAAAGGALVDGRTEVDIYDVLLALTADARVAPLLTELGLADAATVREAVQRRREHPSEAETHDPPQAPGASAAG